MTFEFAQNVSPSTLVSYFFTISSKKKNFPGTVLHLKFKCKIKKKKNNVFGILIICLLHLKKRKSKKHVLGIFIPKNLPII